MRNSGALAPLLLARSLWEHLSRDEAPDRVKANADRVPDIVMLVLRPGELHALAFLRTLTDARLDPLNHDIAIERRAPSSAEEQLPRSSPASAATSRSSPKSATSYRMLSSSSTCVTKHRPKRASAKRTKRGFWPSVRDRPGSWGPRGWRGPGSWRRKTLSWWLREQPANALGLDAAWSYSYTGKGELPLHPQAVGGRGAAHRHPRERHVPGEPAGDALSTATASRADPQGVERPPISGKRS